MAPLKFSIVVPTCHREELLARCLESLRPGTQTADPALYEVVVTDDSKGTTAEAMMREKFPWARWVKGPSRGPAANRNNGVRVATGEWICFIDDDCIASEGWIAGFRDASVDDTIDMMEGRTTVPDATDDPFVHSVSNLDGASFWTCNLAIRRASFHAIGGFDEDFLDPAGEDMEFAHRYHAHNLNSKFFPDALVFHPVRRVNLRSILNRHFSIRWAAMYYFKVDEELHLAESPARNLARAFVDTIANHLRTTWYDIRDWNLPHWKSRYFWLALRWILFPIYLPYYLYWVYRFQKQLNAKVDATEAHPARG